MKTRYCLTNWEVNKASGVVSLITLLICLVPMIWALFGNPTPTEMWAGVAVQLLVLASTSSLLVWAARRSRGGKEKVTFFFSYPKANDRWSLADWDSALYAARMVTTSDFVNAPSRSVACWLNLLVPVDHKETLLQVMKHPQLADDMEHSRKLGPALIQLIDVLLDIQKADQEQEDSTPRG